MTPLKPLFALSIVIVLIVSAGCVGPADTGNRSVPTTISQTLPVTQPLTPTPAPAWCPRQENGSFWITIDPIGDIYRGDPIEIRGETNIPAGKVLDILTIVGYHHSQTRCGADDRMGAVSTVRKGNGCNNTFSLTLDSTNLRSDAQFAIVRSREND